MGVHKLVSRSFKIFSLKIHGMVPPTVLIFSHLYSFDSERADGAEDAGELCLMSIMLYDV